MIKMKDSGVAWIGEIPANWNLVQTKRYFYNKKQIVGNAVDEYERLALTMNGVIKRSKDDNEGLQPEKFEGYQILRKNEIVFKLIDLENVKTSRVGLSPYTGLVSPAYIVISNDSEDNRFYYCWFMFMYYNEVFNHLGGAGVRSALNAKDVMMLPIPEIDKTLQKRLADYLDEKCGKIDAIIEKQQAVIEKLKEYKLSVITETITKGLNKNVEMTTLNGEWVDSIPAHWKWMSLKSVTDFITCGVAATPEYTDKETGALFLSAQNVKQGTMDYSIERYITKELHESLTKKRKPQRGDLLQVRVGASIGNVAVVDTDEEFSVYVSLTHLRCNQMIQNEFLKFCMMSPLWLQKAFSYVDFAGSQGNLNVADLRILKVPVPPTNEQIDIMNYLNNKTQRIDYNIRCREETLNKLHEYKKSLIYEVVTGKKEV